MWRWKEEKHLRVHCKQQRTNLDKRENNSALLPRMLFLNQQNSSMLFYRKTSKEYLHLCENYNLKWNLLGFEITVSNCKSGCFWQIPGAAFGSFKHFGLLLVSWGQVLLMDTEPFPNPPLPPVGGFLTAEVEVRHLGHFPVSLSTCWSFVLGVGIKLSFHCQCLTIPDSTSRSEIAKLLSRARDIPTPQSSGPEWSKSFL